MKKDSEKKAGKTSFDPKDLVDKPIPNVYGPSPEKMRQRRREIEERNRQRRMQREREAQDCDAPIANVYGPMPPMSQEKHTIPNPKDQEKDEDMKGEEEVVEEKRGFFARLFGKKCS